MKERKNKRACLCAKYVCKREERRRSKREEEGEGGRKREEEWENERGMETEGKREKETEGKREKERGKVKGEKEREGEITSVCRL